MGWFIFAILFVALAVGALILSRGLSRKINSGELRPYDESSYRGGRLTARIAAIVFAILAPLFFLFSSLVSNGVGEAKVFTNPDGTIAFTQETPGFTWKQPWQDYADFDLFSQEVLYAGGDVAPSYSGGTVNGKEVTVSVGGTNGGSTQANLDVSVTYSIDAGAVENIYAQYKSQERFTKQVIEKTILSTIRSVPSKYTAVEFRGEFRQEASDRILEQLNSKLNPLGVTVDFVNLQDIRYPESVEEALKRVEEANQLALQQEAELRAAEVRAQQKIVEAQAEADAIAIRNSQSPNEAVLAQMLIQAYDDGTVFVVQPGAQALINAAK